MKNIIPIFGESGAGTSTYSKTEKETPKTGINPVFGVEIFISLF